MEKIKILVAEDDTNIRSGLIDTLESEGYYTISAADGIKACELFQMNPCDLVILDIMMPGKSGYDVCREIREKDKNVPIIMLTAKGEEIDKVVGLQLGADDYITKPFGVHELLARISAILRRASRNAEIIQETKIPERFQFGTIEVDTIQFRGHNGDIQIELTAREVLLMKYFYAHPNEVLSRDRLLNAVWGIDYFGTTRTLDQHIAQLRKKIEPNSKNPSVITTVHGIGYRYECGT